MLGLVVFEAGCVVALGVERDGRASENIEQEFDEYDIGNFAVLDGTLTEEFKKVNDMEDDMYNNVFEQLPEAGTSWKNLNNVSLASNKINNPTASQLTMEKRRYKVPLNSNWRSYEENLQLAKGRFQLIKPDKENLSTSCMRF